MKKGKFYINNKIIEKIKILYKDESDRVKGHFPYAVKIDGKMYTRENQLLLNGFEWQSTAQGIRYFFADYEGNEISLYKKDIKGI